MFQEYFPGPLQLQSYADQYQSIEIVDAEEDIDQVKYKGNHVEIVQQSAYSYLLDPASQLNMGIFASNLSYGFVSLFTKAPLQYYLIDILDASSQQYAMFTVMQRLPLSFKFLFGMLTDGCSVCGYRRKPWLAVGWVAFAALNFYLASFITPGINAVVFGVFACTCGATLADVCTETMCVERASFESNNEKGSLQSLAYIISSMGMVLGAVAGTFLYNSTSTSSLSIDQVLQINGLFPVMVVFGFLWDLLETMPIDHITHVWRQVEEVWTVLQLRALWSPMVFLFLYSMLQVPNSAWYNFLVLGLEFESTELGYLTIAATIVGTLGYIIYKLFLFRSSWRILFLVTSLVSTFVYGMQLLLIYRVNVDFGVPDIYLAIGHDAVVALMNGLHAMPKYIMFVMLCPPGVEGATYAMLTTMSSIAHTVAYDIGSELTSIWDVSNDTLSAGEFSGLVKLTLLTSAIQLVPLLFIGLMPDSQEEHQREINRRISSVFGGFGLLIGLLLSFVYTFYSLYAILAY